MKKLFITILLLTIKINPSEQAGTQFKISKAVKFPFGYDLTSQKSLKLKATIPYAFLYAQSNLTRRDTLVKDDQTQQIHLIPDLSIPETITGLKMESGLNWGIDCKGKDQDLCILQDGDKTDSYYGIQYDYQSALTVIDVSSDFNFKEASVTYPVRLIKKLTQTGAEWPFGATGVLGISKKSDFINYIISQYNTLEKEKNEDKEFVFSIYMKVNPQNENDRFEGKKQGTFDRSYLTINGFSDSVLHKDSITPWLKSSDQDFWSIDNVKTTVKQDDDNKQQLSDGLSCLLLSAPGMLVLPKDQVPSFKKFVMNKLCNADSCDKKSADISKGPKLIFEFKDSSGNDKNFEIKPEKFIYQIEGNDQLQIAVNDLEDYADSKCPNGSKIGFGRLFFLEKYLIFKRIEAGPGNVNYLIGIGDKIDTDDLSKIWLVYSISLGILGFMVVVFALKTVCLWNRGKKGASGEEEGDRDDAKYSKI